MAKKNSVRFTVSITPEFDADFSSWAVRLGVSKSQFANMCIQAGLNALVRAVAPNEAFSPSQMVQLMKEAKKQGLDLDYSNFQYPRFEE
jgi:hypothetical protein